MRTLYFIFLLGFAPYAVAQDNSNVFDEIQENFWYLPTPDGQARLGLTYIGQGDTVVALHGGPGNNFNYLVDAVGDQTDTHCFLLFDQRGSMYSPVADSLIQDLTLAQLVDDLEAIRIATQQDKLTLLGHSFGTLLAMSYYMTYPQHVEKLILTATMLPSVSPEKPFLDELKGIHARVKAMRERPMVQQVLQEEGLWEEEGLTPQQVSQRYKITGLASFNMIDLSQWRRFKGGRVFYNARVDGAIGSSIPNTYDIREALHTHPVPIYIIQGDQDYIDPAATRWKSIAEAYPTIRIQVVPQSSHYVWLDEAEEFSRLLEDALQAPANRK